MTEAGTFEWIADGTESVSSGWGRSLRQYFFKLELNSEHVGELAVSSQASSNNVANTALWVYSSCFRSPLSTYELGVLGQTNYATNNSLVRVGNVPPGWYYIMVETGTEASTLSFTLSWSTTLDYGVTPTSLPATARYAEEAESYCAALDAPPPSPEDPFQTFLWGSLWGPLIGLHILIIAGGLLLLITIGIVAYCCIRRKRHRAAAATRPKALPPKSVPTQAPASPSSGSTRMINNPLSKQRKLQKTLSAVSVDVQQPSEPVPALVVVPEATVEPAALSRKPSVSSLSRHGSSRVTVTTAAPRVLPDIVATSVLLDASEYHCPKCGEVVEEVQLLRKRIHELEQQLGKLVKANRTTRALTQGNKAEKFVEFAPSSTNQALRAVASARPEARRTANTRPLASKLNRASSRQLDLDD
jgi:hypothetical protein